MRQSRLQSSPKGVHNPFTHFPKDPNCPICSKSKMQKRQSRKVDHVDEDGVPFKPSGDFGELVTMDHKISIEKDEGCPYFNYESRKGKHMLVIQDVYTQWLQAYPVPSKDRERVIECLLSFFGPQYHPDYSGPDGKKVPSKVYSDGAQEYKLALKGLHWIAETCTPHRKQTNGIAERAVRRVRQGTAAALLQAGMDPIWWPEASQCPRSTAP